MLGGECVQLERMATCDGEAAAVLEEYYASIGVVVRDDAEAISQLLADPASGMWLAFAGRAVAGCVVLKAGVPDVASGECKRLYVRPRFRRKGIAESLMDALEQAAAGAGLLWVYLDTNAAFAASVALYQRRGYHPCARYNRNPQATLFFRKRLEVSRFATGGAKL